MPTSATDALAASLGRFGLLSGVAPAELARLAAEGVVRSLLPGEVVVRQGGFGHSMFFLLAGSLLVKLQRFDREEVVLSVLKPGATFGELGLAGDRPRSATVIGNETSSVFEIERIPFGRVLGKNAEVVARLDRSYRRACIQANIYADSLFSELPPEAIEELTSGAQMRACQKDEVVFSEGDEADAFYVIWSGHVRISRRDPGGEERVFAYVAEGDYFGETALLARRRRTATVIANDRVELIRIGAADLFAILARYPGVGGRMQERIRERDAQSSRVLESKTRQLFIADMVKLGAVHAASALVIDLGSCTRCGACASACHELYGNSRLTRRGKTFVMPETHDRILMPNSCWHCKDPECMIGCPTDALRRGPSGEIRVIDDRCIGCEICANRCPWGNISMADRTSASRGPLLLRLLRRLFGSRRVAATPTVAPGEVKAVKCDLCHGRPEAACVAACPYGAITRVDPNSFLRRALEG